MSEKEEENLTKTTMATETDETPAKITKNFNDLSLAIWPPSQRTRDAVINRLIESLSAPSILSKRYGTLPADEASSVARSIEDEAFSIANTPSSPPSAADTTTKVEDDGIEILQIYSKEISKRMLEVVKSRAAAASAPSEKNDLETSASDITTAAMSEEISSSNEPESS